jgi:phospholipid/cholesterol/gamma-HCH transport system ATP-binding protein
MGTAPSREIVIQLLGVEKSFGSQQVLRGIDLTVTAGTTTVIVGPSGVGKSLILKHMLGLVRPDRGTVMVLGRDIAKIRRRELNEVRMNFGVLFQNSALFDSMTVFDNVALPLRERLHLGEEEVRARVAERLAMMDLPGSEEKFPAQLSGGMRKRVGLARALVLNPKIVFFDEPTTGLDVNRSNEIYRLFFQTQARLKYTAVIVSHDVPKIFKLADDVALLDEGKIQGFMTPEEFQRSREPAIKTFVEETMGPIYTSENEEQALHEKI